MTKLVVVALKRLEGSVQLRLRDRAVNRLNRRWGCYRCVWWRTRRYGYRAWCFVWHQQVHLLAGLPHPEHWPFFMVPLHFGQVWVDIGAERLPGLQAMPGFCGAAITSPYG